MPTRTAIIALALALAACGPQGGAGEGENAQTPQLEDPAPASEPSRVFAPVNDAARNATGELTVAMSLRLPDADEEGADATDVLTLTGANGVVVEAHITSAVSPATQVQGQTLRALMNLPVEEPQTLVYRVASETRPQGRGGLCGEQATSHVVVWEPAAPGEAALKIVGVAGGAPGAANGRACPMLEYRRQ